MKNQNEFYITKQDKPTTRDLIEMDDETAPEFFQLRATNNCFAIKIGHFFWKGRLSNFKGGGIIFVFVLCSFPPLVSKLGRLDIDMIFQTCKYYSDCLQLLDGIFKIAPNISSLGL